jgi:hypothetical protein
MLVSSDGAELLEPTDRIAWWRSPEDPEEAARLVGSWGPVPIGDLVDIQLPAHLADRMAYSFRPHTFLLRIDSKDGRSRLLHFQAAPRG